MDNCKHHGCLLVCLNYLLDNMFHACVIDRHLWWPHGEDHRQVCTVTTNLEYTDVGTESAHTPSDDKILSYGPQRTIMHSWMYKV